MRKIDELLIGLRIKASCALEEFKNSERGDTNFISILIILGVVVVFAALFISLGNQIQNTAEDKVTDFLGSFETMDATIPTGP